MSRSYHVVHGLYGRCTKGNTGKKRIYSDAGVRVAHCPAVKFRGDKCVNIGMLHPIGPLSNAL